MDEHFESGAAIHFRTFKSAFCWVFNIYCAKFGVAMATVWNVGMSKNLDHFCTCSFSISTSVAPPHTHTSSFAGPTPNLGADERISAWYDSGHEGEINFANVIGCASSSTECTCLLPYWTGKFCNFPFGCKIQVLLTKWQRRADSFRITTARDGLSQRSWKMIGFPFVLKYFKC